MPRNEQGRGRRHGIATPLPRFLLLYAALYAAFGVISPFLPALFASYGFEPVALGLVMAVGTVVRLTTGPWAGRAADQHQASKPILVGCAVTAALMVFGYLWAARLWVLLLISAASAASLAPLTPVSDALTLAAAGQTPNRTRRSFEYGWVRAVGSAAFILGAILAGRAIGRIGLAIIVWL